LEDFTDFLGDYIDFWGWISRIFWVGFHRFFGLDFTDFLGWISQIFGGFHVTEPLPTGQPGILAPETGVFLMSRDFALS
jgi:hypothetical protein